MWEKSSWGGDRLWIKNVLKRQIWLYVVWKRKMFISKKKVIHLEKSTD